MKAWVCPFLGPFFDYISCPYLADEYCDEIEVSPGNSDAWCYLMIEKSIEES